MTTAKEEASLTYDGLLFAESDDRHCVLNGTGLYLGVWGPDPAGVDASHHGHGIRNGEVGKMNFSPFRPEVSMLNKVHLMVRAA